MAFLKFNKSELVNLEYSLKREIIEANRTGAYCNTSIVTCNTRRYHGLLAVPIDSFGGGKYMLLSSVDESLIMSGKQFNLGIHCYGDVYEPRGHKYIVDFDADPVPEVVYKVGDILFKCCKQLICLLYETDLFKNGDKQQKKHRRCTYKHKLCAAADKKSPHKAQYGSCRLNIGQQLKRFIIYSQFG